MKTIKQWLANFLTSPARKRRYDIVDESSRESFPASDPPAWAGSASTTAFHPIEDPISLLKEEHRVIMKVIYAAHELIERLEQNKSIEVNSLKSIIEFMRFFVDKNHHLKEENYLFPALEHSGAPLKDCPLALFRVDHQKSLLLLDTLEKTSERYAQKDPAARPQLIKALSELKDIYTRHTLKEENFVFPLAEKYLSKGEQKTLLAQFEKMNETV